MGWFSSSKSTPSNKGGFFSNLVSGAKKFFNSGAGSALLEGAKLLPIPGLSTAITIGQNLLGGSGGEAPPALPPPPSYQQPMPPQQMPMDFNVPEAYGGGYHPEPSPYEQQLNWQAHGADRMGQIQNFGMNQPNYAKTSLLDSLKTVAGGALKNLAQQAGIPSELVNQFANVLQPGAQFGQYAQPSPYGLPYSQGGHQGFSNNDLTSLSGGGYHDYGDPNPYGKRPAFNQGYAPPHQQSFGHPPPGVNYGLQHQSYGGGSYDFE